MSTASDNELVFGDLSYPSVEFDQHEPALAPVLSGSDMTQPFSMQEHLTVLPSKVLRESDGSYRAYPESSVHWTAQSVLQWLESLAQATEAAGESPLIVNGVRLSEKSLPPVTMPDSRLRIAAAAVPVQAGGEQSDDQKFSLFIDTERRDPDGWWNCQQMEALARLVKDIRSLQAPFQAIIARFDYTFDRILEQSASIGLESRYFLDTLYQNTIIQLQEMLDSVANDSEAPKLVAPDTPIKKDFAGIMTSWLVQNWTNPYPDEEGLAALAVETDTGPSVVGNWLINARTRKWRPSIVKASKYMDRPASLLMEDSINIFSGIPLREVEDDSDDESSHQLEDAEPRRLLATAGALYPPTKRFKSC